MTDKQSKVVSFCKKNVNSQNWSPNVSRTSSDGKITFDAGMYKCNLFVYEALEFYGNDAQSTIKPQVAFEIEADSKAFDSVDEFIKEPDKKFKYHISFAFNDVEKEEIIKYYPGNLNTVNENNSTEQRNHWNRKYLKEMLDKNGIPENDYSLWNEFFHDTITLYDNSNALWEIIYMDEKGNKSLLKVCPTEDAACRCLYDYFVNGKSL